LKIFAFFKVLKKNFQGSNGHANENGDHFSSNSSLSSSCNLANKEFNHLPRVNIQIVGMSSNKCKLPESLSSFTQLSMNWLIEELVEKHDHVLNDFTNNVNMLYMNAHDQTLHDCCDMDSSDCNFNDYINDYQKQHSANACGTNSAGTNGGHKKPHRSSPTNHNGTFLIIFFVIDFYSNLLFA
jgi:hypothetical protein